MNKLSSAVPFDEMVEALANVQRRKLLVALMDHNPQNDTPVVIADEKDAETMDRLVSMRHVHLPKLAEAGFIEWDEASHEVAKGEKFDEIRPLLELLDDHSDELPEDWL